MIYSLAVMLIVVSLATATSGAVCVAEGDLGTYYRGDVAVMASGQVCQRWDSASPNRATIDMMARYIDAGLDENYCRNPEGDSGGPWCYNSEGTDPMFGSCTVPTCGGAECVAEGDVGKYYRGNVAVMASGQVCQRWDSESPNRGAIDMSNRFSDAGLDENYCRNPDEDSDGPWCYNSEGSYPMYGSCTVPTCEPCQGGTYRDSSMMDCLLCPTNTYSAEGAELCTDCPRGSLANDDRTKCEVDCSDAANYENSECYDSAAPQEVDCSDAANYENSECYHSAAPQGQTLCSLLVAFLATLLTTGY